MKIEIEKDDCVMLKKYAHAEVCFHSCEQYLNIYIDDKVKWKSAKSRALLSTAVIEYGKPFKKSRGGDKIDESIIPAKYKDLHDMLMKSRDKYVAHIDKKGVDNSHPEIHKIHLTKKGPAIY